MNLGIELFDRKGHRKYLSGNERHRFLSAVMLLPDEGERAFAMTLFYTGCRISEALSLTPKSVDSEERLLVIRTLKQRSNSKYRAIPIPEDLVSLLSRQTNQVAEDQRIWRFCRTKGWKIIKCCMTISGLDGIKATPKGLRHGYAIACVSVNVPLPTLQRWLGHASLQTTGIYLDFVGEDERELAARAWPSSNAQPRN